MNRDNENNKKKQETTRKVNYMISYCDMSQGFPSLSIRMHCPH